MVLRSDEVRMVIQFHDLATQSGLILADIDEACRLDLLDSFRLDFVAVAMSLIDVVSATVESTNLAIIDEERRRFRA